MNRLNTTQDYLTRINDYQSDIKEIVFFTGINETRLNILMAGNIEATEEEFKGILSTWFYYHYRTWPEYQSAIRDFEKAHGVIYA